MRPLSSGSRSTSSTWRLNSGSSSRKSTPWCASEISPGRGGDPPPTSATAEAVWCGARHSRTPIALDREPARREALHRRGLERLVLRHRGKDPRQALREHRLAGAGRAGEQDAVRARRRDLERAPGLRLAFHVREVRPLRVARARHAFHASQPLLPLEMRAHGGERRRPDARSHRERAPPRCADDSGSTKARPSRCAASVIASAPRIGRSSPESASSPANSSPSRGRGGKLPRGDEDAQREGEVEAAAFLRKVRGSEVGDDAALRETRSERWQARRGRGRGPPSPPFPAGPRRGSRAARRRRGPPRARAASAFPRGRG